MTNVMLTGLGRKWWFVGSLSGLSGLLSFPVLQAAGLGSPENWAQWLLYFLCFSGIWKCLSVLGWFAVLLLAPSSTLLDPAKR